MNSINSVFAPILAFLAAYRRVALQAIQIVALAFALCSGAGFIARVQAAEPSLSPVLVELFTAEGCSSCPPADEFVAKLDALQPISGAELIVLSEHMNYWDDSWPDRFASSKLTTRQADYERVLERPSPYTPQLIVDGTMELYLTDRPGMAQVFRTAAASPKIPVSLTSITVEPGTPAHLSGNIEINGSAADHKATVYLAAAIDKAETKVLRGENGGKTLAHVAVVEYFSKVGVLKPGQNFSQTFRVSLERELASADTRLIVFLQEGGNGKVVGAAMQRVAHHE